MSRKQTLWLASGLWGAGFMVSGAFAFAMNQPLMHYNDVAPTPIERVASNEAVVSTPAHAAPPALTFDAVEIKVPRAQLRAAAPVVTTPPPVRDIEEMRCSEPRALEQGGNFVRECE